METQQCGLTHPHEPHDYDVFSNTELTLPPGRYHCPGIERAKQ